MQYGNIVVDGNFTDWSASDIVSNPGNAVSGYNIYGQMVLDPVAGNTYVIGLQATDSVNDAVIGAGTTLYLNTDQNTSTGYSPFGSVGAEYIVNFVAGSTGVIAPYLYDKSGNLISSTPLDFALSTDGKSVELAIRRA